MKKYLIVLLALSLISCQSAQIQKETSAKTVDHLEWQVEAQGRNLAVSTQGVYSTQVAQDIYETGGNIIDAAVAVSFALGVERPQSTGIGGGGFMMFHEAKTGKTYAIDFRERAPLKASKNMFLDKDKKPNTHLSQEEILAVGTPGLVAGLFEIHKKFGHLKWSRVIQPAIGLAKKGFPVYPTLAHALRARTDVLVRDPDAEKIFLKSDGKAYEPGEILVQKDLAATLTEIAKTGEKSFYHGKLAQQIAKDSDARQGSLTLKDLEQYKVKWREPIVGDFHGYKIYSMPPPSSGGVLVIQFLNMLADQNLMQDGFLSPAAVSKAATALQLAFADRAAYLGDPDFVKVPTQELTSTEYAKKRFALYNPAHALDSSTVAPGDIKNFKPGHESSETTHFSIMDKDGNAVSSTQTINGWMGAGIVAHGTGIILNNEMDDFAIAENTPNMFGAVGTTDANTVAPLKTPLSSMSPTIVMKDNQPVLAVGAPGGTRIISCTAQTILNYLEFHKSLYDSVAAIRYHDQWKPDELDIDPPGLIQSSMDALTQMGYHTKVTPVGCYVMAVARDANGFTAVADPRDIGTSFAH